MLSSVVDTSFLLVNAIGWELIDKGSNNSCLIYLPRVNYQMYALFIFYMFDILNWMKNTHTQSGRYDSIAISIYTLYNW